MMTLFLLVVAVLACGLVGMYRLVMPARTNLVRGVASLERDRERATSRAQAAAATSPGSLLEQLGSRVAEVVSRRARDLTSTRQDLAMTGQTLDGFVTKMTGLALVAFFAPPALQVFAVFALELSVPALGGLIVGAGLSVAMVVLSVRDLHAEADERRTELRETLSVYLDWIAMCLTAGRAPEEALPAAAAIGSGWTFVWIQDAIETARWSRTTPGEELGAIGRRVGVSELVDLETSLQLSWQTGSKLTASLAARASTLRDKRVADAKDQSKRITESMRLGLLPMVGVFLVYELFPSIFGLFTG